MKPLIKHNRKRCFAWALFTVLFFLLVVPGRSTQTTNAGVQTETAQRAQEAVSEALTLSGSSNYQIVRERFALAKRLWVQAGEPEKIAQSASLMGDSYLRMKFFQEAIYYYNQAIQVKSGSPEIKATTFLSLAKLYAEIFQTEISRRYYELAGQQGRAIRNISIQVESLLGLATIDYQSLALDHALLTVEEARRLNLQTNDEEQKAALLYLTGCIAQKLGAAERARQSLQEAFDIYQRHGEEGKQSLVLHHLSELCQSAGQLNQSYEYAQQAVQMADTHFKRATSMYEQLNAREFRWRASLTLARAQRARGQKEEAIKSYYRSISSLEPIYLLVTRVTDAGAISFGEERRAVYGELVDMKMDQGKIEEAFHLAEQSRSRSLLGLLQAKQMATGIKPVTPDNQLRELSKTIADLRTQLLSPSLTATQRLKIEESIDKLEGDREEAQAKSELSNAKARFAWFQPFDVKQVQEKLSPPDEYVLDFFIGQNRSFLWLISLNEVSVEILPGRQEIEKAVEQYLNAVTSRPNNLYIERQILAHNELADELFTKLSGKLAEKISQGKRLIIVPDGILHYLPFESLHHNGRYLVEDHEISYMPSASILGLLQNSKNRLASADRLDIFAIGDPLFTPLTSQQKQAGSNGNNLAQGLRQANGRRLIKLPWTKKEIEGIASLFPVNRQRCYLGNQSTEEVVKTENLRRYRFLHFATHGILDEKAPSRSAIVLAQDMDPQEDGFLEVGEIANLDLNCELVVLSACQTGRGKLFSGEGVIGLSRAFLYAGTQAVMVSLWNVSDYSTSMLMKTFYQQVINDSLPPAALREAKLQMLKSNREIRHPFYWAPFIVVGAP